MTPGTTHTAFGRLCKRAREKGLEVGLTVGNELHGEKGKEYRLPSQAVLRPADKPKGTPVLTANITFANLDRVSDELVRRLG